MKALRLLPLVLLVSACASTPSSEDNPDVTLGAVDGGAIASVDRPPPTRTDNVSEVIFGQKVEDPYRWLENESSPEVQHWVNVQNAYARAHLRKFPVRPELVHRLKQLFYVDTVSSPVQRGERLFFLRRPADKDRALLYVKDAKGERVLLDPNGWERGTATLGVWVPSWDGKKVAYCEHPNNADAATLHVVDVATGKISSVDVIDGARYAVPSWMPDNKSFFYEYVPSDPKIPVAQLPAYVDVRRHKLGQAPAKDEIVHPKIGDPTLGVAAWVSRDGKYLFYEVDHGWTDNTVAIKRLGVDKSFKLFADKNGARYDVMSWKDVLYIRTDEGAPRQHIFRVAAPHPERKNWKEIVREDPKNLLEGFGIYGGRLGLQYLTNATSELKLADLNGSHPQTIEIPAMSAVDEVNGLPDSHKLFYSYESLTTPRRVVEVDLETEESSLWAQTATPVDPAAYDVRQIFYPSKDGTKIPMFLVMKKGLKPTAETPALLYGYGGFDVSLTPYFRAGILPWLDAGGIFAMANLRGGGEYGKTWHEAGQLHNKQNVFDDFAAAAQYLIQQGMTSPPRLAIWGASNGGLLMGVALTQHPELFGAVVCGVPLLDMVRYDRFGEGKTWIPEYGNPAKEADFKVLYAYSPYHHVRPGVHYPPLLMMSSDHDDRVDPLHARKFVAEVQNDNPDGGPTYLRVEAHAGHGGAGRVDQAVQAQADMYSFLFQVMKIGWPAATAQR